MSEPAVPPVPETLVAIRLVPVEVFTGMCDHDGCMKDHGYGIADAVSAWSDCNRAVGQVYRRDEPNNSEHRDQGDTVTVYVNESDLPWFDRKFGEETA